MWVALGLCLSVTGLVAASTSRALEKTTVQFPDPEPWAGSGATCTLAWYNVCTDYLWNWSDWGPTDRLGAVFEDSSSMTNTVQETRIFIWHAAAGPGWGYTGMLEIYEADENGCPTGLPVQSQFWHPISGWNTHDWSATVGPRWVVAMTFDTYQGMIPPHVATDHPAAGPTGPQPCGTCYPEDRPVHSFFYGTPESPLCPGSTFYDGVCNAELIWACRYVGAGCKPVSTTEQSWAKIKALFR